MDSATATRASSSAIPARLRVDPRVLIENLDPERGVTRLDLRVQPLDRR